jgi:hypothetical protein
METTTPSAMVGALLRVTAYSVYRGSIENELFSREDVLHAANISDRIENGFPEFAGAFLSSPGVSALQTAHPFDSHPPLAQRTAALKIDLRSPDAEQLLNEQGDGDWYRRIANATALERQQWEAFEASFREHHKTTLPYRLMPRTEEERAIVEGDFPEVRFDGSSGVLVVDYEKMIHDHWSQPLYFREIASLTLHENTRLQITYDREDVGSEWLYLATFGAQQQSVLNTVVKYRERLLTAIEYQQHRQEACDAGRHAPSDG